MATFGIFLFSGLFHVSFLQHLDGASMCCFLISRQKGPAPFFPVTAFETGVPAVGEMQTAKHRSAVQATCSALHRSSWLSTDAGQQLHLPVEIWDETKCSTVLKDARHLFIPIWLNLWGLNSANWYVSQFCAEKLSCWESSTLQSAALKGLLWEASSLEMWWCGGACVLLLVSCFSGSSGFCLLVFSLRKIFN